MTLNEFYEMMGFDFVKENIYIEACKKDDDLKRLAENITKCSQSIVDAVNDGTYKENKEMLMSELQKPLKELNKIVFKKAGVLHDVETPEKGLWTLKEIVRGTSDYHFEYAKEDFDKQLAALEAAQEEPKVEPQPEPEEEPVKAEEPNAEPQPEPEEEPVKAEEPKVEPQPEPEVEPVKAEEPKAEEPKAELKAEPEAEPEEEPVKVEEPKVEEPPKTVSEVYHEYMKEPGKSIEEIEELKAEKADELRKFFSSLSIKRGDEFDSDKELGAIRSFVRDPDNRKNKQAEAEKMLFDYIEENKLKLLEKNERDNIEAAFAGLGVLNPGLAKKLASNVNDELKLKADNNNKKTKKMPPISVNAAMKKFNVKGENPTPNTLIESPASENPRIQSLEKLYSKLTSRGVNHMFSKNSPEFNDMVKSIKHTLDYAKMSKQGATEEVLDEMLKDVAQKTSDYIDKKPLQPSTPSGKARQDLALSVLVVANRKQGLAKIDALATKLKAIDDRKVDNIEQAFGKGAKRFNKEHYLSVDKLVASTKVDIRLTKAEKIEGVNKYLKDLKTKINAVEGSDMHKLIGKYIAGKMEQMKISSMSEQEALDYKLPSSTRLDTLGKRIICFTEYRNAYEEAKAEREFSGNGVLLNDKVNVDSVVKSLFKNITHDKINTAMYDAKSIMATPRPEEDNKVNEPKPEVRGHHK